MQTAAGHEINCGGTGGSYRDLYVPDGCTVVALGGATNGHVHNLYANYVCMPEEPDDSVTLEIDLDRDETGGLLRWTRIPVVDLAWKSFFYGEPTVNGALYKSLVEGS